MIPTERLLYKIELKLNKLASNQHQGISLEDRILALNEAQIRLIKKKINPNNLYQLGFDSFKSRYEDLQDFIVQYEELTPEKTKEIYSSYKVNLENTKNKYFLPVDIIINATRGKCKDRVVNVPRIVKHSDLTTLLQNTNFEPSFLYQETLAVISSNDLIIYSNDREGEFQINKVFLSYLRYPNKINYEGYIDFDGTESTTINCELPDHLEDELLALTVMELGYDTDNPNAAQAQQNLTNYTE